jgi:signal peptidase II
MKKRVKIFLFIACCCAFIGCDRVTKDLAKEHLKDKPPHSYLNNTVKLQYVENTGAALSLGDTLPKTLNVLLLSVIPLLILIIVFAYTIKNSREMALGKLFSIALIFAGGIGNIIDRILFDRHVPDFIIIGFKDLHTGVFNIADVCVMAGVAGLLFFYQRPKPSPIH